MKTIQYQHLSPKEWFEILAKQIPATIKDNQFIFHHEIGNGKMQYLILQEGLWVCQMNFELVQTLSLIRNPKDTNDCFALNFYFSDTEILNVIDKQTFKLGYEHISILLNSAAATMKLIVPVQKPIKILKIGFTREWLKRTLLVDENVGNLAKLFLSDKPFYILENLDYKFKEILKTVDLNTSTRLSIFSSVLQLFDYLVLKINKRASDKLIPANIHYRDFRQLVRARNMLDTNLKQRIPIEELAEIAEMSLSKFKRLFGQVFGTTPYKYYLENKMERAMEMLIQGKQSVSEVGFLIGYTNLSQFTKAFKKHHGVLPSMVRSEM